MMIQSHDNDRFYILLCDLQLGTKKFYYLVHIHCVISRDLAHHELTQDKIDCRIVLSHGCNPKAAAMPSSHLSYEHDH